MNFSTHDKITCMGATDMKYERAWRAFEGGKWCEEIDVRDFIQRNYTPY